MQKLTIWASRWDQSTPKVRAIFSNCPPLSNSAKKPIAFNIAHPNSDRQKTTIWPRAQISSRKEESVEHDRFSESNGQNRLNHDLRRGAGVPPHRVRSSSADQTDANCCSEGR